MQKREASNKGIWDLRDKKRGKEEQKDLGFAGKGIKAKRRKRRFVSGKRK
jgi:hypothetical protein